MCVCVCVRACVCVCVSDHRKYNIYGPTAVFIPTVVLIHYRERGSGDSSQTHSRALNSPTATAMDLYTTPGMRARYVAYLRSYVTIYSTSVSVCIFASTLHTHTTCMFAGYFCSDFQCGL